MIVRIWTADIISIHKICNLRGPWGLTAVFQLIYELMKNCCGTGRGGGLPLTVSLTADRKILVFLFDDSPMKRGWKAVESYAIWLVFLITSSGGSFWCPNNGEKWDLVITFDWGVRVILIQKILFLQLLHGFKLFHLVSDFQNSFCFWCTTLPSAVRKIFRLQWEFHWENDHNQ